MSLLEKLVERIYKVWKSSTDYFDYARAALIDTVSVASAAYSIEPLARRTVRSLAYGQGPYPLLGAWKAVTDLESVAGNAYLAHSIEFDDWIPKGFVHAGSVVIPSALASAIFSRSTLNELLKAIIAGYEAAALIGRVLGRSHYRYWHSTATAGSSGAATSSSLLLEGSLDSLESSVTIALNYMGGMWSFLKLGGTIKPYSSLHASLNGYMASKLASNVKIKINRILEDWVCKLLDGECIEPTWDKPAISYNEIKPFPTCRHTHTAIEASLEVHKLIKEAKEVKSITLYTYSEAANVAAIRKPSNVYEARFSLTYLVSLALSYGKVDLSTIGKGLKDPLVSRLEDKVTIIIDKEYDLSYPKLQPARLEVVTSKGQKIVREILNPLGGPERPLGIKEVLNKAKELSEISKDPKVFRLADLLARAPGGTQVHEIFQNLI